MSKPCPGNIIAIKDLFKYLGIIKKINAKKTMEDIKIGNKEIEQTRTSLLDNIRETISDKSYVI